MPRYTGWRRLSGNTADRPDLLDLGKRLLGELETQRRLSGVKTCSLQRQAPDGSIVRASFIGDIPAIDVHAAGSKGASEPLREIVLRLYAIATTAGEGIATGIDLERYLVARDGKIVAAKAAPTILPSVAIPGAEFGGLFAPNGFPRGAQFRPDIATSEFVCLISPAAPSDPNPANRLWLVSTDDQTILRSAEFSAEPVFGDDLVDLYCRPDAGEIYLVFTSLTSGSVIAVDALTLDIKRYVVPPTASRLDRSYFDPSGELVFYRLTGETTTYYAANTATGQVFELTAEEFNAGDSVVQSQNAIITRTHRSGEDSYLPIVSGGISTILTIKRYSRAKAENGAPIITEVGSVTQGVPLSITAAGGPIPSPDGTKVVVSARGTSLVAGAFHIFATEPLAHLRSVQGGAIHPTYYLTPLLWSLDSRRLLLFGQSKTGSDQCFATYDLQTQEIRVLVEFAPIGDFGVAVSVAMEMQQATRLR